MGCIMKINDLITYDENYNLQKILVYINGILFYGCNGNSIYNNLTAAKNAIRHQFLGHTVINDETRKIIKQAQNNGTIIYKTIVIPCKLEQ